MSHRTRVTFTVKETADGEPFLFMEALDQIPNFPENPPVFDLQPGTDMEEAEEIARFLNSKIAAYRPEPLEPVASFQTSVKRL